ncbi:MAG: hypothetical protein Q9174_002740 [Haloplaca sp. 1 TL-2023]
MDSDLGNPTEIIEPISVPTITKTTGTAFLPTPPFSRTTSNTSSGTDETKLQRPKMTSRKSSDTMIIPRDAPTVAPKKEFPPDDARAMSPRRSIEETEKIGVDVSASVHQDYLNKQKELANLQSRVEAMRSTTDTLDSNNQAIQGAIGEMTRSLSNQSLPPKKK